jgi:hypothetical protein
MSDRRLFACPAQIPHDVESVLFAGLFIAAIPLRGGSIPRENWARARQSRFVRSLEAQPLLDVSDSV